MKCSTARKQFFKATFTQAEHVKLRTSKRETVPELAERSTPAVTARDPSTSLCSTRSSFVRSTAVILRIPQSYLPLFGLVLVRPVALVMPVM